MENPIKNGWFGGKPTIFGNTHIVSWNLLVRIPTSQSTKALLVVPRSRRWTCSIAWPTSRRKPSYPWFNKWPRYTIKFQQMTIGCWDSIRSWCNFKLKPSPSKITWWRILTQKKNLGWRSNGIWCRCLVLLILTWASTDWSGANVGHKGHSTHDIIKSYDLVSWCMVMFVALQTSSAFIIFNHLQSTCEKLLNIRPFVVKIRKFHHPSTTIGILPSKKSIKPPSGASSWYLNGFLARQKGNPLQWDPNDSRGVDTDVTPMVC